jgi:hypothetical protein
MGEPLVRRLGEVEGHGGQKLVVGIHRAAVAIYFGAWLSADGTTLDAGQQEEFAQLYNSACWEAGRQGEGGRGDSHPPVPVEAAGAASGDQLAAGALGDAPAASTGRDPAEAAAAFLAYVRRLEGVEVAAREMLASFTKASDGHRARVGQVQIAKWVAVLDPDGVPGA